MFPQSPKSNTYSPFKPRIQVNQLPSQHDFLSNALLAKLSSNSIQSNYITFPAGLLKSQQNHITSQSSTSTSTTQPVQLQIQLQLPIFVMADLLWQVSPRFNSFNKYLLLSHLVSSTDLQSPSKRVWEQVQTWDGRL
jgi:hypothetical protein